MITTLRSKLHGLGFRIAMGILLLIIAIVWVVPQVPQISRQLTNDWVIDVNGQKILLQDFLRKYRLADQQLQMIKQQYGPYADYFLQSQGIPTDPQEIALNELTADELLNQTARAIPIDIGAEYIQEKLKDRFFIQGSGLSHLIPVDLIGPTGAVDSTLLQYYLKKVNLSASQFEELIERALERYMLAELIGLAAYVPTFQVKDLFNMRYSSKKYSILSWSVDQMIEKEKQSAISDQELQQFYTEQTTQNKRYWVPEKRAGFSWEFRPELYGIVVADAEVQRYYDRNKSSFVANPVQLQVRRLLFKVDKESLEQTRYQVAQKVEQELKADSSQFARLAKEYSDDTATASKGGLMEPFSKGDHDRQFEQSAFLLKKDGDISNIFKSQDGFEIVQRVSKKPVSYKPFALVAQEIRQNLINEKFKKQFAADVARVPKNPNVAQLESFAKEHNAAKKETISPTADEGSAVAHALFNLKVGEITSVGDQDMGYLVQLNEIKKGYLPELSQIKREVSHDVYAVRARKRLQEQMDDAHKRTHSEPLEQIRQEYGLKLHQTGWVNLGDEKAADTLKDTGIPMGYFTALEKTGGVLEYQDGSRGYLIKLDEIGPVDEALYLEKEPALKGDEYREEIRRYIEGFVASLHRNATINFNESIKLKDRAS